MFIELIDLLRCPADHPPINLVAVIVAREDRRVIDGVLGCPTCRREYAITGGIAWFTASTNAAGIGTPGSWSGAADDDGPLRAGAFLSASDGGIYALIGEWARDAAGLADIAGARVFAVNPAGPVEQSEQVGTLYCDARLPFRDESLSGIAIGAPGQSEHDAESAMRSLSAGGRMVAPAWMRLPAELDELARDDSVWIGEKRGPLVSLHRR
jgi:uncharacterized protein YbaR (Trm112 family)